MGQSLIIMPNKEVQFATLVDGKREGKGVITRKNGYKLEAFFQNDLKNGKAVEIYPNGSKFEGEYVNDLREGDGLMTMPGGDIYKVTSKAGTRLSSELVSNGSSG